MSVASSSPHDILATTIITYFEALQGRAASVLKADNGTALLKAMALVQQTLAMLEEDFQVIPVDQAAATHFDKLRMQKKFKMKRADMLVASITLAQQALLVTRNLKDYKHVAGLRVENWVD
jgi:tRNA(fMet)-specific endonuclease VapC